MPPNNTYPENVFSLQPLAPVIEGRQPPSGPFDPSGKWVLRFTMYTIPMSPGRYGELTLEREPTAAGFTLRMTQRRSHPGQGTHLVTARMHCLQDRLATPREWRMTSTFTDPTGKPVPDLRIEKRMRLEQGSLILSEGRSERRIELPGSAALNWALFEAVQRLPGSALQPTAFTLVDHFDEVKKEQTMAFRATVDLILGSKRVIEELTQPLAAGVVHRPVRVPKGGTSVKCRVYEQLGRGNLPMVYWVSSEGRLLFVSAGLEAYVLRAGET